MQKFRRALLALFVLVPLHILAADCEVEARLQEVQIQNCNGERFVGTATEQGALADPLVFDAIPLGLETFWSDVCQCYLWQVSGIAGAHTHLARFYQTDGKGRLTLIPGGEFGSEIGKISRVSQNSGFIVEVRDSDVTGKHKTSERYRFDGRKFIRIKTP